MTAHRALALAVIPASIRRLDELEDPLARKVLDLRARTTLGTADTAWACGGCDPGDYAQAPADWPCQTVELVAAFYAIDLTDFHLFHRPRDGSLDAPPSAGS